MSLLEEARARLAKISNLQLIPNEPLARHTRFGVGGPADLLVLAKDREAFLAALRVLRVARVPWAVIGGGTNLVVSDDGFRGVVLRFDGRAIERRGGRVWVEAGCPLQEVVDFTIAAGLAGLHTLTGIPGSAGAAVYGNAGAYGHSMMEFVRRVEYFDGHAERALDNPHCEFRYRESVFKRRKDWLILAAELELPPGDAPEPAARAAEIRAIRDAKYPPEMKCAGSIFKNLLFEDLPNPVREQVPPALVREGKVPAAWFLEACGARGMRLGGIVVADYHANLIYNDGSGTANDIRQLIHRLKRDARRRFHILLEEEVQYMGFAPVLPGLAHLEGTPYLLQHFLTGLSSEETHWKPAADRWSIAEVLAHLDHVETHCFGPRLRQMAEQDHPEVQGYHPEAYKFDPEYRDKPTVKALDSFARARVENMSYLIALAPDAGTRTARHTELGTITLEELLNEWAFHDLGHTRQILELIRAAKYYPRMGPFRDGYQVAP